MLTFFRYASVAAFAYALDMGGYYLLLQLSIAPVQANVAAKVVAAVSAFFLHRLFTYRIKENHDTWTHARRYFFLCLINTPVSTLLLYLLMLFIGHPIWAKAIADVALFIANYWVTTRFAFARQAKDRHG